MILSISENMLNLFLNQNRTQTFLKMLQSTLGEEHCVLHDRLLKGTSFQTILSIFRKG